MQTGNSEYIKLYLCIVVCSCAVLDMDEEMRPAARKRTLSQLARTPEIPLSQHSSLQHLQDILAKVITPLSALSRTDIKTKLQL